MFYFMALAFAVGLGVPIAAAGAALGQGKAASSALESMARQPEILGKLQTAMVLSLAFIESLVIFSLLVFLMLKSSMPDTAEMLNVIKATGGH
jgi:F-type H+-transporting ATPase subunit c